MNILTRTVKSEDYVSLKTISRSRPDLNYLKFKFFSSIIDFDKIKKIQTIFYFGESTFNNIFLDETHTSVNNYKSYNVEKEYADDSLMNFYKKNQKNDLVSRRSVKNNIILQYTVDNSDIYYDSNEGYLTFNLNRSTTQEVINSEISGNIVLRNFFFDKYDNIILDTGFTSVNIENLVNNISLDSTEILTDDIFDVIVNTLRLSYNTELNLFNVNTTSYDDFFIDDVSSYDLSIKYKNKIIDARSGISLQIENNRIASFSPDLENLYYDILKDYLEASSQFRFDIQIFMTKNDKNYYGSKSIVYDRSNNNLRNFITKNLTGSGNTTLDSLIKKKLNITAEITQVNSNVSKLTIKHNVENLEETFLDLIYVKEVKLTSNANSITRFYPKEDIFNIITTNNVTNTQINKIKLSEFLNNSDSAANNTLTVKREKSFYINTNKQNINNLKLVLYRKSNVNEFKMFYNIDYVKTKKSLSLKKSIYEKYTGSLLEGITINNKTPTLNYDQKIDNLSQINEIFFDNVESLSDTATNDFGYSTNDPSKDVFKNTLIKVTSNKNFSNDNNLRSLSTNSFSKISTLESLTSNMNNSTISGEFLKEIDSNDAVLLNNRNLEKESFKNLSQDLELEVYPISSVVAKYKNKGLDASGNVIDYFDDLEEVKEASRTFYEMFYDVDPSMSFTEFLKIKKSYFMPNESSEVFENAVFKYLAGNTKSKAFNFSSTINQIKSENNVFDLNLDTNNNTPFDINIHSLRNKKNFKDIFEINYKNIFKDNTLNINIPNKIKLTFESVDDVDIENSNLYITCNIVPVLKNDARIKLNDSSKFIDIEDKHAIPNKLFYDSRLESFKGIKRGLLSSTINKFEKINNNINIEFLTNKNQDRLMLNLNLKIIYQDFLNECKNNEINFIDNIFIMFVVYVKSKDKSTKDYVFEFKQPLLEKDKRGIFRIDDFSRISVFDTL